MGQRSKTPPFFLLSFIPAVVYWLLETYSTLEIALIGGVVLGILEMAFEKRFTGHVHTLSKLNVGLIVGLGGIALIAREGLWFKLQPTLTGFAVAGFLVFKKLQKKSLMIQMLTDFKQPLPLPSEAYHKMEWHMCLFLILFAVFMARVAIVEPTSTWLFWKTAGFYIAFGVFMVLEMLYLRWFLKGMKR